MLWHELTPILQSIYCLQTINERAHGDYRTILRWDTKNLFIIHIGMICQISKTITFSNHFSRRVVRIQYRRLWVYLKRSIKCTKHKRSWNVEKFPASSIHSRREFHVKFPFQDFKDKSVPFHGTASSLNL